MDHIEHCKKCKKRKFVSDQGLVCGLTGEKPTFEDSCMDFEKDETIRGLTGLELKPNEQRAKVLLSLIWIVLVLDIVSVISSGLQYNLLQRALDGAEITNSAANANDVREGAIAIIYLIAYLSSAIAFIFWFRRAYFNLHQKVKNLSFTEGWAAGCWFVPIVNLFRPYVIMKEMYDETRSFILTRDGSFQLELTSKFVGLWWGLWILNNIIGQISYRIIKDADTIPGLINSTTFDIVNSIIGVALAIVTIRVIRDYSNAEGMLGSASIQNN